MKKSVILFLATLLVFGSCSKESQVPENNSIDNNEYLNYSREKEAINFQQIEMISKRLDELKFNGESNSQRSDCIQTAFVPDDFATIQDAIDAVCENGNVFVRSGVYNESPGIETAGIFIKAIGDVTLKGGFGMGADNVKIHGFKIDNAFSRWGQVGIASAPGYNGFDLKHNTIYSTENNDPSFYLPFGHIGIYLEYCDNAIIAQNNISGNMETGIYIDAIRLDFPGSAVHPYGSSNNNTISNNSVTEIFGDLENWWSGPYYGTCIQLRGNTDNTLVNGNYTDTSNGWGISLWSFQELGKNCDGNIVKNNIAKNNFYNGLEIFNGGSNNTLGPNNKSYENAEIGIFLYEFSNNNHVFNNTSKSNAICDVVNFGFENTFKNIKADCTFGVD